MGPKPKSLKEALPGRWKYNPVNGCWEWRGPPDISGYGRIWHNRQSEQGHRASWMLHKGPIPDGLSVLHRCDNRKCVNPMHLFLGTKGINNTDRAQKNRSYRGPRPWAAKVDDAAVREIRALRAAGVPGLDLARKFNLTRGRIYAIALGRGRALVK